MTNTQTPADRAAHAEALDRMADAGQFTPIEGTRVYRGYDAGPLTDDDLLSIFAGRPRDELKQPTRKTWQVRTTPALDQWAEAAVKTEGTNLSALIRQATAEYLAHHYPGLRSQMA